VKENLEMDAMCHTDLGPRSPTTQHAGAASLLGHTRCVVVLRRAICAEEEDRLRALACLQRLATLRDRLAAMTN